MGTSRHGDAGKTQILAQNDQSNLRGEAAASRELTRNIFPGQYGKVTPVFPGRAARDAAVRTGPRTRRAEMLSVCDEGQLARR